MKIFPLLLLSPFLAQAPDSGSGYNTTVQNKDYGKEFLSPDADPTKELEATYPQSTFSPIGGKQPGQSKQVDSRTTGGDFSAAKAQAVYWLGLLDQKAYAASWAQAGGLLQDLIGNSVWVAAMKSVRGSLGNNTGRKVSTHNTATKLPHGTKGNFMIVTFDSSFSGKSSVKEKVILMAEGSKGDWKVIAYNIQG